MTPCMIGYGAIAHRLISDPRTVKEGNRYWKWIETYAGADYDEAVRIGSGKLISLWQMSFLTLMYI